MQTDFTSTILYERLGGKITVDTNRKLIILIDIFKVIDQDTVYHVQ